ncbi:MAG: 1-deoxy-D-xylulose-5-phosphate reductoisomerase [Lachnospiraceae bacterium]|nr:1-deoxy-D-xylulose-5-phosphate reductoisomerase [Lachnospiraceae bacterium]
MNKRLIILGSTGSIGTQALEVARDNKDIEIVGLAAKGSVDLVEKQVREFNPKYVAMYDESAAAVLKERLVDLPVAVYSGMDGLLELSHKDDYDILLTAIVGMIGIRPTIEAINSGKDIALANKETLVTAGHIIMPLAKEKGVQILPVDSEHSAIFQSLQGNPKKIKRILLTASGGPFRGRTRDEMKEVTVADALKHPNWSMGRKITIDSATMVNKGLEVMEAKWLFDVDYDQIQVVVHPESILHSAVEYVDGAVIGQMGVPDMKLPIQYALYYPDRMPMHGNELDLFKVGTMNFMAPDMDTFYGLKLAIKAGKRGGSLPTVYNAANERAVALFLDNKIKFLEIAELIEKCMDNHKVIDNPSLDEILNAEQETYDYIDSLLV